MGYPIRDQSSPLYGGQGRSIRGDDAHGARNCEGLVRAPLGDVGFRNGSVHWAGLLGCVSQHAQEPSMNLVVGAAKTAEPIYLINRVLNDGSDRRGPPTCSTLRGRHALIVEF